jgi:hypothetical protein
VSRSTKVAVDAMLPAVFLSVILFGFGHAAPAKLTVLESDDLDRALIDSRCKILTPHDVSSLPTGAERKNVCFYGTLYADREFEVVFPSTPWDVTIMLPARNGDLERLDGKRVLLIGNLHYDYECWAGPLKPHEKQVCAPAERPIYLTNGTLIPTK